MFPVPGIT